MTTRFLENFIKKHPQDSQNGREACGKFAGTVGIVCNLLLSVMKLVVGTLTNSVAITADATNNISDAGSSVITLVVLQLVRDLTRQIQILRAQHLHRPRPLAHVPL